MVLVLTVAGCAPPAEKPGPTAAAPPVSPTTTGLLPTGVPTEGTRPPDDGLPPPAEPQRAPAPAPGLPGRQLRVGDAPAGVVVDAKTRTVAVATRNPHELVLIDHCDRSTGIRGP
ncbi:hypothetical protein C6A86_019105 [Mycobacterium sp. ITM-2016-00316]|uniref:hypothetical protein n=1 Tax=Mycobacterium sp. ITM-2016-00316 TaxID=2099695 RepID=UPI000CF98279|nr:hypothetical protein [Mycobacterium sp. ITM-2016-00316]WNG80337.1 hypothetical protein C6A86_019105 [Mycobacterium sp. ITM-2016-00316]